MTYLEAAKLKKGAAVHHPAWTQPMYVFAVGLNTISVGECGAKGPTLLIDLNQRWGKRILALLSTDPPAKKKQVM